MCPKIAHFKKLTCSLRDSMSYGLGVKSVWTRALPQKGPV